MASNQHYIEKADTSVKDLVDNGGYLVPVQAKQFMELLIEESVLLGMVTTVPMAAPTYEISKMGFTGRVLHAATENTALPANLRSKPELGKVSITTQEYIAEARIPYGVVEDNIQNGTFNDIFMRYLAKAVARDMEEFAITSDTTSPDPDLARQDGLIKQQVTLTINAGGVRLQKGILKQALQTLPSRYIKSQKNLAFITSKNAAVDYADSRANRIGVDADKMLQAQPYGAVAEYAGYPVVPVPLWPEDLGNGQNMTVVSFMDPKNYHVGIQRQVRVETDRDITARQFIIVATVRFGFKFAHEPATVLVTNVLAAPGT